MGLVTETVNKKSFETESYEKDYSKMYNGLISHCCDEYGSWEEFWLGFYVIKAIDCVLLIGSVYYSKYFSINDLTELHASIKTITS